MSPKKKMMDKYQELRESLGELPHITQEQVDQWVSLQRTIDKSRDYLIRAVPDAKRSVDEAQKILEQRTYTLIFFGGTGVGKSTLINALLGRNLLPTGAVTAVTGTIIYIEQAQENEAESLTFDYWSRDEFSKRVRRLCQLAEMDPFNIADDSVRAAANQTIIDQIEANDGDAKTEKDEYLEILLDCIATYEAKSAMFSNGPPPSHSFDVSDNDALTHLREDGFKGSEKRQIRLVKSATFKIHPSSDKPNLLMNGYLRIVDVPGLGAGMRLHEAITLEEMKREDAMIVLVSDAGRQRVDEMKSLAAVTWIKENRLFGLRGGDLDEAAAKIFLAINGGNVRQAFDRLNAGLPESEREVKEVTRYISPNYWERYKNRGNGRPYFLVMAPSALYVQDPTNAPAEFAGETERILKTFADQLSNVNDGDPLAIETSEALLELSEIPLLRDRLVDFIKTERILSQLREAATRVRNALQVLRFYYEKQLASRGVYPPYDSSWDALQERRYENLIRRHQKELPKAFHGALLDLSRRVNSDFDYRRLIGPTLAGVKSMVEDSVRREVNTLLDSYGTEHWDDRDVTFDSLVWGTSGIEVPIKRILYQVELVMQEAVAHFMPEVADVLAAELERTLDKHEISEQLLRISYGQPFQCSLPQAAENLDLSDGYKTIIDSVGRNYRQICRQATMYELLSPERSIHAKVSESEENLLIPEETRLLDLILGHVELTDQELISRLQAASGSDGAEQARERAVTSTSVTNAEGDIGQDIIISILDEQQSQIDDSVEIRLGEDFDYVGSSELGANYAERLDDIAGKTNQIFIDIIDDLFAEDELLPRLRRLFWFEASRAEREFNLALVQPLLKQLDRSLTDPALRKAMEPDLESVSDVEELMRIWEGLHDLEETIQV